MVSTEPTPIVPTQPIPAKSLVIKTDKPRPYVCATCTRSFARLEHLKRHERSHTKEKPFQCPVCERSFARRDLLLRHKQKLHANVSPNDTKRNSISGPCVRNGSLSATFSPGFSPSFSPQTGQSLNPLEHELMGSHPISFSRSQSFSAVSADSYMPDSAGYHNEFDDNTINPQMLRQEQPVAPQSVPYQQPVHMGIRRNRRFNSNASAKPFIDSPDYSIASSSLSQFDSPSTVPYQSPPTDFSQGTPLTQQHHWAGDLGPQGLPQLGMPGFEQSDDFMNSLLNLDDRFEAKTEPGEVAPHEIVGDMNGDAWLNMETQQSLAQDAIPGFSSSFTSSLLKHENQSWPQQPQNPHQHHHQHHQQPHQNPHHQHQSHIPSQHMSPYQHSPSPMEQPHQHGTHIPLDPSPHGSMQPPPPPPPPPPTSGLPLEQPTIAPQSAPSIGLQNLPSSQEVRRLVAAFYSNFNTPAHFVQHGPDLASQNMALVMSMAALGALYLNETQTANQIFDLSCDCIRMFSDLNNISGSSESGAPKDIPIWLVQASMLSLYYLMYVGSNHNFERIAAQASNLVHLAQRARLDRKPSEVLDVPGPTSSIEEKFKYHVAAERRVRTMYAVFIATSYCEMCLRINVGCNVSTLECGSPRSDSLMIAETAEAWWKNPNVRKLSYDTDPFSTYLESIKNGEVLNSSVAPTVLLSLVCALIKQLCDDKATSVEQKEKVIHTWESSWSNSSYSSNTKDDKTGSILSDCAPIASLAMMRIRIMLPIGEHCRDGDYQALDNDLTALRLSQPEDLVDAAVYALDAFVTIDDMNRKKCKMFFPSITFLVEASIILSEALAVIEAMAQPLEKHQRLLMRAHKILSQLAESDTYSFASDALFNIQNPQTSLSTMAIRIAIALFQCNIPVPPLAFECLKSRLGS